ncbi:hypothetical protein D031_3625A, partial [Vibrio parahaemolyticus VP-48]
MIESYHF